MNYCENKAILDRLHRVKGQISALEVMYQDKRACHEILQQIMAARSSLGSLACSIIELEAEGYASVPADQHELRKLIHTLFKVT